MKNVMCVFALCILLLNRDHDALSICIVNNFQDQQIRVIILYQELMSHTRGMKLTQFTSCNHIVKMSLSEAVERFSRDDNAKWW